jgi:hypothetical protein
MLSLKKYRNVKTQMRCKKVTARDKSVYKHTYKLFQKTYINSIIFLSHKYVRTTVLLLIIIYPSLQKYVSLIKTQQNTKSKKNKTIDISISIILLIFSRV